MNNEIQQLVMSRQITFDMMNEFQRRYLICKNGGDLITTNGIIGGGWCLFGAVGYAYYASSIKPANTDAYKEPANIGILYPNSSNTTIMTKAATEIKQQVADKVFEITKKTTVEGIPIETFKTTSEWGADQCTAASAVLLDKIILYILLDQPAQYIMYVPIKIKQAKSNNILCIINKGTFKKGGIHFETFYKLHDKKDRNYITSNEQLVNIINEKIRLTNTNENDDIFEVTHNGFSKHVSRYVLSLLDLPLDDNKSFVNNPGYKRPENVNPSKAEIARRLAAKNIAEKDRTPGKKIKSGAKDSTPRKKSKSGARRRINFPHLNGISQPSRPFVINKRTRIIRFPELSGSNSNPYHFKKKSRRIQFPKVT